MAASFEIYSDPSSNFFEVTLVGLFDVATAERFTAERDAALLRLVCEPHSHYTLCDVSGCLVQPRETADVFARIVANPPRRSRRMAFVVGSPLARMQLERIAAGRSEVAVFNRRGDALAWLRAEGARPPGGSFRTARTAAPA